MSVYNYADSKVWLWVCLAIAFVILWSSSRVRYITDEDVMRYDGIIESVDCRGMKNEKVAAVTSQGGFKFMITVVSCGKYKLAGWPGRQFFVYYHPAEPLIPIKTWIEGEINSKDGWNKSLIASTFFFAGLAGFFAYFLYCCYRKIRSEAVAQTHD